MIIVLGSVVARSGRHAEALALSLAHVARSRLEPGCIAHAVHQDTENPERLVFVERWADRSALLQHFKVAESKAFAKALAALAAAPPGIEVFECSEVGPTT
jgi:quinol monooxygenase YgiN